MPANERKLIQLGPDFYDKFRKSIQNDPDRPLGDQPSDNQRSPNAKDDSSDSRLDGCLEPCLEWLDYGIAGDGLTAEANVVNSDLRFQFNFSLRANVHACAINLRAKASPQRVSVGTSKKPFCVLMDHHYGPDYVSDRKGDPFVQPYAFRTTPQDRSQNVYFPFAFRGESLDANVLTTFKDCPAVRGGGSLGLRSAVIFLLRQFDLCNCAPVKWTGDFGQGSPATATGGTTDNGGTAGTGEHERSDSSQLPEKRHPRSTEAETPAIDPGHESILRVPGEEKAFQPNSSSMLQIMREVAIARVRTRIPNFSATSLDKWIMSTGYQFANAPHSDTGDLIGVYAASMANSGGRKPDPENFGALIRAGVQSFLSAPGIQAVPTLAGLAVKCRPHVASFPLGGTFANDITTIAEEESGRVVMERLLNGVLAFMNWLLTDHQGSAAAFHGSLLIPHGGSPGSVVFPILRSLSNLPMMGIATAANFVKDSQLPGLIHLNPRTLAATSAGWFAKPDRHVARFMAYITGRAGPGNLQQLDWVPLFRALPAPNFQGNYVHLTRADRPEMRVIADIHEWATSVGTSALEIDRVLYLIGVQSTQACTTTINAPWYSTFVHQVDAAIGRGVLRKS